MYIPNTHVQKLVDCGINDFQITIDGTKKHHDGLRILRNGKPTFDKIFRNIIDLAEYNHNVKISLRVNFNHTNIDSIPELLEQFPLHIRNQIRVTFEPIFGNCLLNAINNIDNIEISEKLSVYYKFANKFGFDVTLGLSQIFSGKLVYCYAERFNQYVINYNGDVFKCSVCNFAENERVGYINQHGIFIKEDINYSKWLNGNIFDEKCYQCQYLPLCMGGCKKMRIEQKNTGSNCSLVPTNTSYLLKQIAFNGLSNLIKKEVL